MKGLRGWAFLLFLYFCLVDYSDAEMSAMRVRRERRAVHPAAVKDTGIVQEGMDFTDHASRANQIYICPMHADYRRDAPGVCGVCGMALQAVVSPSAPLASVSNSRRTDMPTAPVRLTRRQAELLSLEFAEIQPRRIERWIRTSASRVDDRRLVGKSFRSFGYKIQPGQRVRAAPMACRNRVFSGVVRSVENQDAAVLFEIELDDEFEDADVYAVEIIESAPRLLPAIPSDAILFTNEGLAAFRIAAEDSESLTIRPVPVRIGSRGEMYYEVLDGLAVGDRVAQVGLFYLDAASKLQ